MRERVFTRAISATIASSTGLSVYFLGLERTFLIWYIIGIILSKVTFDIAVKLDSKFRKAVLHMEESRPLWSLFLEVVMVMVLAVGGPFYFLNFYSKSWLFKEQEKKEGKGDE